VKVTKRQMAKALKDMPYVEISAYIQPVKGAFPDSRDGHQMVMLQPNTKICDLEVAKKFVLDLFKQGRSSL